MSIGVSSRKRSRALARRLAGGLFGLVCGAVAAACSTDMSGGTAVLDDPVARRLNWFAYLDGADIKRGCGEGADDRARMVLNGRYTDQVRTYDLRDPGGAGAAAMETHVFAPLQVNQGALSTLGETLSGRPQEVRLNRAETAALWDALARDGAFAAPPRGLWLDSQEVWWIATGCRDGQSFLHAWKHPSAGFARLTFPDVLKRNAVSDVPWPRLDQPRDFWLENDIREGEVPHFRLEVTDTGIRR